MFSHLIASKPAPRRGLRISPALLSLSCHAAVVLAVAIVTAPPPELPRALVPPFIYLSPNPLVSSGTERTVQIPPVSLLETFDPVIAIPDIQVPASVPVGIVTPTPPAPHQGGFGSDDGQPAPFAGLGARSDPGRLFNSEDVDEAPVPIGGVGLRYPEMLRQAGLEGSVLVEFVIDTAGKVEVGSVRVIDQAHRAFVDAAVRSVRGARFLSARVRGRPVRVLVRQWVTFRLTGGGTS